MFESIKSVDTYMDQRSITIFDLLKILKFISTTVTCLSCGNPSVRLSKNGNRDPMFKCGRRICRKMLSYREGTILSLVKVPPTQFIKICVGWIKMYTTATIMAEANTTKHAVTKTMAILRNLIGHWMMENHTKIGGPGHIVEIDESVFGKRKFHVGRRVKSRWVVGGVDRQTKRVFIELVDNRKEATLTNLIKKHVLPGTIIFTDCWKGYVGLGKPDSGYVHRTVNHSRNFVDPRDGTNTQTIESLWSALKRSLRKRNPNMSTPHLQTYLKEYEWRARFSTMDGLFDDFVLAVQTFTPRGTINK